MPSNARIVGVLAPLLLGACAGVPASFAERDPRAADIAFLSNRAGSLDVYVLSVDDVAPQRITHSPRDETEPALSPDGLRVAFVTLADGDPDVAWSSIDADTPHVVARHPAADVSPAWSPDAAQLVFVSDRGGTPELYRVDLASGELAQLTHGGPDAVAASPRWSPRGDLIAYLELRGRGAQLVVVDPHGGKRRVLSNRKPDTQIMSPAWSPDGTRILYAADEKDRAKGRTYNDLYLVDVTTGVDRRLTESFGRDGDPAWSPDGLHVAFLSSRDTPARRQLFVMRADGSGQRVLDGAPQADGQHVDHYPPAWSADGRWIYFGRHVDDNAELFRIRLEDARLERITTHRAFDGALSSRAGRTGGSARTAYHSR